MSFHDYITGRALDGEDHPFYGLIQAAMRKADSDNVVKLRAMFPDVWDELEARYHAPGGFLPGECPERRGSPHHFIPRRTGVVAGEPAFELRCDYCNQSEKQTREKD